MIETDYISPEHLSYTELDSLNKICLKNNTSQIKKNLNQYDFLNKIYFKYISSEARNYLNQYSSKKITTSLVEVMRWTSNDQDLVNYNNLLLADHFNINQTSSLNGNTPLYQATIANNLFMVKDLIERGADCNAKCDHGSYPLVAACTNFNNLELLEYLLSIGSNPNIITNFGETALTYAVQGNSPQSITQLINAGANVNFINHNGKAPLNLAMLHLKSDNIIALCKSSKNQQQIDNFKNQVNTMSDHSSYDFVISVLNSLETKMSLESSLKNSNFSKHKSPKI